MRKSSGRNIETDPGPLVSGKVFAIVEICLNLGMPNSYHFVEFISFFPLPPWGGEGRLRRVWMADEATPHPIPLPSQGRGDLVASV